MRERNVTAPNWAPLEQFGAQAQEAGHELDLNDFMWMHGEELPGPSGLRWLDAYKHLDTRRYIFLDGEARPYALADGAARPQSPEEAIGWVLS